MRTSLTLSFLVLLAGCGGEAERSTEARPDTESDNVFDLGDTGEESDFSTQYDTDDFLDTEEADTYQQWERDQAGYAREQVEWERDDLRRSVRNLQYGDWENDLPRVERELRDMDNALWDLEMADPDNPAVLDLRYEVDRMKRETRRLGDENWRDVVPDLDRSSRNIDYGTDDLDSHDSFDDDW